MFLRISIFTVLLIFCSSIRVREREAPVEESSFCPAYENCKFYQVNKNLTDYGCTTCKNDYLISADITGAGFCKIKNSIENCVGAMTRPDIMDSKPFCFECKRDYIMANDSLSCLPVDEGKKIVNCVDYFTNSTEVFCNACEKGFTLSEDRTKCEEGCNISNCNNCQMVLNNTLCFNCNEGFIGVVDPSSFIYTSCLSCDEYQYNLKVMGSNYRPS